MSVNYILVPVLWDKLSFKHKITWENNDFMLLLHHKITISHITIFITKYIIVLSYQRGHINNAFHKTIGKHHHMKKNSSRDLLIPYSYTDLLRHKV